MNNEKELFLSEQELFQLTGYKQRAMQLQWLDAHKYFYINDGGSNSIRLSREHVKEKMNGNLNE